MNWLVSAVARLAGALNMEKHMERLSTLRWRLTYGIREELMELVINLEGVGRARARALYNAGFKSVIDIANADPKLISGIRGGFGDRLARSVVEQARKIVEEGKVVKPTATDTNREMSRQVIGKRRGSLLDYL